VRIANSHRRFEQLECKCEGAGLSLRTHYAININGSGYEPSRIIDGKGGSLFYQQTRTYDLTEPLILGATPPSVKQGLNITVSFTYK